MLLKDSDYMAICEKSRQQYEMIHKRQERDLKQLLSLILSKHRRG